MEDASNRRRIHVPPNHSPDLLNHDLLNHSSDLPISELRFEPYGYAVLRHDSRIHPLGSIRQLCALASDQISAIRHCCCRFGEVEPELPGRGADPDSNRLRASECDAELFCTPFDRDCAMLFCLIFEFAFERDSLDVVPLVEKKC